MVKSKTFIVYVNVWPFVKQSYAIIYDKNKNNTLQFPYKHVFQKLKSLSFSSKQVKVKNITFYQYFFLTKLQMKLWDKYLYSEHNI